MPAKRKLPLALVEFGKIRDALRREFPYEKLKNILIRAGEIYRAKKKGGHYY